jgi:putative aldouronate transport system substrate-binding protein
MKRLVSLALILMLVLSATSVLADEPIAFSYIGMNGVNYPYAEGKNWVSEYLLENYNLDVTWVGVDSQESSAYNMFWAGNGYADVFTVSGLDAEIAPRIEDGVARSFPIEWIKEYAPRLWELCTGMAGGEDELITMLTYKDGKCYQVPQYHYAFDDNWVCAFNEEWMMKLGLEIPETLDDWTNVLKAMTYDDPDGNGVDDTHGFTLDVYNTGTYPFAAAFGTSPQPAYYLDENNQVYFSSITDNYKAYLAQMHEWYAAGYIDPEFLTDTRAEARAKFTNNKIGVYNDNVGNFLDNVVGPYPVKDANDEHTGEWTGTMLFSNTIVNTEGKKVGAGRLANCATSRNLMFGEEASDEVIIAVLKLVNENQLSVNPDLYWTLFYGEKDVDWTYETNANGVQCLKVITPLTAERRQQGGFLGFYPTWENDLIEVMYTSRYEGCEHVARVAAVCSNENRVRRDYDFLFPSVSGMTLDKKTAIEDYVKLFKNEIISGQKSLDADWDNYVAEVQSMGIGDILSEYQATVDVKLTK